MAKRDRPAALEIRDLSAEPNLVAALAGLLEREMQSGRWRPGDRLPPEAELAGATGVSRTVVREAVAELRSAGLVRTRRGAGTVVIATPRNIQVGPGIKQATLEDILFVLELRLAVEVEAAALAAQRRTEQDLAMLEEATREMERRRDTSSGMVAADLTFHVAIAAATKNPYLCDFLDHLGKQAFPRQHLDADALPRRQLDLQSDRILAEHESILAAIRAGDVVMAGAQMRVHLAGSRMRYQALAAIKPAESDLR